MRRRISPLIILTGCLLSVLLMMAILKSSTRADSIPWLDGESVVLNSMLPNESEVASVIVNPLKQGSFIAAGQFTDFVFLIKNNSDSFSDIFELEVDTTWPTELLGADGETPLSDSNNDGRVDTDFLSPGHAIGITARITAPSTASKGDNNSSIILVISSNDPPAEESVILKTAVPADFSQAFRDEVLGVPTIFFAQIDEQWAQKITASEGRGAEVAVAETISGYVYVWSHQRLAGNNYVTEIETVQIDKTGNVLSGPTKLTNHGGSTLSTHDVNPVVAVDPGGNIGIAWHRQQYDQNWNVNQNIFIRMLDEEGIPISTPINLTNNSQWGPGGEIGLPDFDSPRIAALVENGFFVAWQLELKEETGSVQDIYFAIINENGDISTEKTNLTNDAPDDNGNVGPALAGLSTNRVLLSWINRRSGDDDLFMVVIDSGGNIVKGPDNISDNETVTDWWNFDAAELSNGSILLAWQAWGCIEGEYTGRIRFALLNSKYRRIGKPTCLGPEGVANAGDKGVSVTADAEEHGIITWTDHDGSNRRNLYYALLDKRGNIITEPLSFYQSDRSGAPISLNIEGYAITSRRFIDGVAAFSAPQFVATQGQEVKMSIRYGNKGTLPTGALVLTTTLQSDLTYVRDTAPGEPIINGQVVTWELSELAPAETRQFDVFTTLPATAPIGAQYPVTVSIGLESIESTTLNNSDLARILVLQPYYLPFIRR